METVAKNLILQRVGNSVSLIVIKFSEDHS